MIVVPNSKLLTAKIAKHAKKSALGAKRESLLDTGKGRY
jgi:hypothetical protein